MSKYLIRTCHATQADIDRFKCEAGPPPVIAAIAREFRPVAVEWNGLSCFIEHTEPGRTWRTWKITKEGRILAKAGQRWCEFPNAKAFGVPELKPTTFDVLF